MKLKRTLLVTFLLFGVGDAPIQFGQNVKTEIFFRKDITRNEWCAYKNESQWRSEIDAFQAETVGGTEYVDNRIAVIHLTTADATADWAVYDEYSFDRNERLQGLKRNIDVIPGRLTEEQIFRIRNGKAVNESSNVRELGTGKPTNFPGGDWRPNLPVITTVDAFPFWLLVHDKRQEILKKGKVCIAESR